MMMEMVMGSFLVGKMFVPDCLSSIPPGLYELPQNLMLSLQPEGVRVCVCEGE